MSDDFEDELVAVLTDRFDVDTDLAVSAAARGSQLVEDWDDDGDVTPADLAEDVADGPYDDFQRDWNYAVGKRCADVDRCTDSREYRLAGFDDVAAVQ